MHNLPKVRGQYRFNAHITNWFDVGGKAEILFKPEDIDDLAFFLKNKSPIIATTIIGAGSNIIVKDKGIKGVVIRLGKGFNNIEINGDNAIKAYGACLCANVANFARDNGLAGLEFLSGIPGSLGGAIAMNAGCYNSDISQILVSATAMDQNGNIVELARKDFDFAYRSNNLASKYIFISAVFSVKKSSFEDVSIVMQKFQKSREETQPIRAKTGGSTFKNPKNSTKKAWELIDQAGLRGFSVNDAEISSKHCNFLINKNNASAEDLINLINIIKKKVKDCSGVDLEEEIKILE